MRERRICAIGVRGKRAAAAPHPHLMLCALREKCVWGRGAAREGAAKREKLKSHPGSAPARSKQMAQCVPAAGRGGAMRARGEGMLLPGGGESTSCGTTVLGPIFNEPRDYLPPLGQH